MVAIRNLTRRAAPAALALAAVTTVGCGRDLIFTTYSTVGVEVRGVNNIPTSLRFAYKRFEGAIVPVDMCKKNDDGTIAEAHSIFGGMDVQQKGFRVRIAQVFATGAAADGAAESFPADEGVVGVPTAIGTVPAGTKSAAKFAGKKVSGLGMFKTLNALRGRVGFEDALGVRKGAFDEAIGGAR